MHRRRLWGRYLPHITPPPIPLRLAYTGHIPHIFVPNIPTPTLVRPSASGQAFLASNSVKYLQPQIQLVDRSTSSSRPFTLHFERARLPNPFRRMLCSAMQTCSTTPKIQNVLSMTIRIFVLLTTMTRILWHGHDLIVAKTCAKRDQGDADRPKALSLDHLLYHLSCWYAAGVCPSEEARIEKGGSWAVMRDWTRDGDQQMEEMSLSLTLCDVFDCR